MVGRVQERPLGQPDVPAVLDLQRRVDVHWFGAAEHDEAELRETLDLVDRDAGSSLLLLDGGRLLGAGWWWGSVSTLLVDPGAPPDVHDRAVAWFERAGVTTLEVLSRDEVCRGVLLARGWRYDRSQVELVRAITPDWVLDEPRWPPGTRTTGLTAPEDLHHLIYVDAAWSAVPGHPHRSFEDWSAVFRTELGLPEQQVLAWEGDRLVGCATGRVFSDGTGWVSQLAVARDRRGRGLGRALLLAALRRRAASGATALGLGVSADNPAALGLHLGVGLTVDREWQDFRRP